LTSATQPRENEEATVTVTPRAPPWADRGLWWICNFALSSLYGHNNS